MFSLLAAAVGLGAPPAPAASPAPEILAVSSARTGWQPHAVVRTGVGGAAIRLPATFLLVSAAWNHENAQMPELVDMRDRKRLLMTMEIGPPTVHPAAITSDDGGATWSERRWLRTNAAGAPDFPCSTGLTYLGGGTLIFGGEGTSSGRWISRDGGLTWPEQAGAPAAVDGQETYHWDPALIDRDRKGRIVRLLEARYTLQNLPDGSPERYISQAFLTQSEDAGKSWSAPRIVPQWARVNEVALCRARNGDLVAACRTDIPARFRGETLDNYCGLATSISHDNGATWSPLNRLFDFGRHHPCMVVMPDGAIVMTYVVRLGYTPDTAGMPRFGVEAVVSRDHGATWDLDHRYILAYWSGKVTGPNAWWGLSQSTSTVRLRDGSLLTAFGTGFRNEPTQPLCIMDVAMVRWRIGGRRVGGDRTIRDAEPASDTRNRCDPAALTASTR